MATAYITEYARLARDARDCDVPVGEEPAVATQKVTFTTSTQSTAFNAATRFVLIDFEDAGHVAFGTNPTATANSPKKAASSSQFFGLAGVGSLKVAIYDGTS